MDDLRIYFKLIRIAAQSRLQYRADFIIGVVSVLALNAVNLGLIAVLVTRFVHLNGWRVWELVFLYCLWMLGHSIYSLLFWHLNAIEDYLIEGTFDEFLFRPVSPLVQLLGRQIHQMGVGDVLVGVAGLVVAYRNLQLRWDLPKLMFLILAVASGTMIETALSWMISCVAFWTGRSSTAFSIVTRMNLLVQQYPIDIFGRWFRVVVTGIVPVAFMNYYPSLLLLGRMDASHGRNWLCYMSPVVAVLLISVASAVWRLALRHYTSSGS